MYKSLLLLLVLMTPVCGFSQGPEKIYVQIDKPLYAPGDNIWYAVHILDANTLKATPSSEMIYIDLIAPNGSIKFTQTRPIIGGRAFGDFELSEDDLGGLYRIRAYTTWNKNFGELENYERNIPVQTIQTERIQIVTDFEKDGYTPGDTVRIKLKIFDRNGKSLKNGTGEFSLLVKGRKALSGSFPINKIGNLLNIILPTSVNTADVVLQITAQEGDTKGTTIKRVPVQIEKVNIQFFPEGGSWVNGQVSTIGFKATNEFGKGSDVSGIIVNSVGDSITSFESIHKGMGKFRMRLNKEERYRMVIDRKNGHSQITPIALNAESSYSMHLSTETPQHIEWIIYSPHNELMKIAGKYGGRTIYDKNVFVTQGLNSIKIFRKDVPGGILEFTLFDSFLDPQAERLVFNHPKEDIRIDFSLNQTKYQPGDSVQIKIHTTLDNTPVPMQLAIGVTEERLITKVDDKQAHLLAQMYLDSQIKGEIEEPNFYFDPDEEERDLALDNLLLTQGYREFVRFTPRQYTFPPDRISVIRGMVTSYQKSGRTIRIAELSDQKRILSATTDEEGHFQFAGLKNDMSYILIHDKSAQINLFSNKKNIPGQRRGRPGGDVYYQIRENHRIEVNHQPDGISFSQIDVSLEADVTSLSEVIVTAYGSEAKNSLTSAITVRNHSPQITSLSGALQGRVAGVQITSGSPGAVPAVRIRGVSSINQHTEPLLVIDGIPQANGMDSNISMDDLAPGQIESIQVIRDAAAAALYGSRATSGVIVITTNRIQLHNYNRYSKYRGSKYQTLLIPPFQFNYARKFFRPAEINNNTESEDNSETMFWKPNVITDAKGQAVVSFKASEVIGRSRIIAEGFSTLGLIGRADSSLIVRKNIDIEVSMPDYMGISDELLLPVIITNGKDEVSDITVDLAATDSLFVYKTDSNSVVRLNPLEAYRFFIRLNSKQITGHGSITINASNGEDYDSFRKEIKVRHIGIPHNESISSNTNGTYTLNRKSVEAASFENSITFYGNVLQDVKQGLASLLAEPHGCFEQASATTFPNVLALQLMLEDKSIDRNGIASARNLVSKGYKKLTQYEVKGGGFDWFGKGPASLGLSAYGLLEFYEMQKVYTGVDNELLDRTRRYILAQRDGKGGFITSNGKFGFAGASKSVTSAYAVFALAHTGSKSIDSEYSLALKEAWATKDMYRLALMANAAHDLGYLVDYEKLMTFFQRQIESKKLPSWNIEHSIVRSAGGDLATETLSLWMLAVLKAENASMEITALVDILIRRRKNKRFGSTQATVMALMALTRYEERTNLKSRISEFEILVDGKRYTRQLHNRSDSIPTIKLPFQNDMNVEIRFLKGDPIPYSIDSKWHSLEPENQFSSDLSIKQSFMSDTTVIGESVRLNIEITNNSSRPKAMTIARVGLPAGFNPEPWQLKELMDKDLVDYYEIIQGELHLYYREFPARKTRYIELDMLPTASGTFKATPASVYEYYNDQLKSWDPASEITVLDAPIQ